MLAWIDHLEAFPNTLDFISHLLDLVESLLLMIWQVFVDGWSDWVGTQSDSLRLLVITLLLICDSNSISIIFCAVEVFDIQLASSFEAGGECSFLIFPGSLLTWTVILILAANLIIALHEMILTDVFAQRHIHRSTPFIEFFLGEGFWTTSRSLLILFWLSLSFRCIMLRTTSSWTCPAFATGWHYLFESYLLLLFILLSLSRDSCTHGWGRVFKADLYLLLAAVVIATPALLQSRLLRSSLFNLGKLLSAAWHDHRLFSLSSLNIFFKLSELLICFMQELVSCGICAVTLARQFRRLHLEAALEHARRRNFVSFGNFLTCCLCDSRALTLQLLNLSSHWGFTTSTARFLLSSGQRLQLLRWLLLRLELWILSRFHRFKFGLRWYSILC